MTLLSDPVEKDNRARFDQMVAINEHVAKPVAEGVKTVVTPPVAQHLSTAARNLEEPRIFSNSLLQLRLDAALISLARFGTNSTVGLAGLFDVASKGGLPRQTADFGQTLHVWGVEPGVYIVAPIVGPTTTRDLAGSIVDTAFDPVGLATTFIGGPILSATISGGRVFGSIDQPAELDDAVSTSLDPYARVKSLWVQNRTEELNAAATSPFIKLRSALASGTATKSGGTVIATTTTTASAATRSSLGWSGSAAPVAPKAAWSADVTPANPFARSVER